MHKDTAKWLLTFVPIPTFVVLALSLGPRYEAIEGDDPVNWLCENWVPAVAFVVAALATFGLTLMCCLVLLTGPTDLGALMKNDNWLSAAFNEHGVGEPMFTNSSAFKKVGPLVKAGSDQVTDQQISAYNATNDRLRTLSEDLNTRARFRCFVYVFIGCAILILGGLTVATATLPATPDAITKPTKVSILVPLATQPRFTADTNGCTCLHDTTAIAMSGIWTHPKLRLIGKGCPTDLWTPPADLDAVIAPT
jgi:hypothetical protein